MPRQCWTIRVRPRGDKIFPVHHRLWHSTCLVCAGSGNPSSPKPVLQKTRSDLFACRTSKSPDRPWQFLTRFSAHFRPTTLVTTDRNRNARLFPHVYPAPDLLCVPPVLALSIATAPCSTALCDPQLRLSRLSNRRFFHDSQGSGNESPRAEETAAMGS